MFTSLLAFIVVLGVLIFFHELGHFLVARLFGVGVEKFSLGFGPRLIGKKIGITDYRLSAIPLGGYVKMITSLIDFSFIRSLVADCYSAYGPPCYDPSSLFLLDLFRYIDGHQNMSQFLELIHDKDRGSAYRTYSGISMDHLPSEGTFSTFRIRLGEKLYNEIFHVLVDIFHQLEMITFKILAHDGTLYPTWARYKGCTYFCNQCACIRDEGVIGKVKNRILYRLNNLIA